MTTTTAMTKLVCAECRHENEAERTSCHNCGERLDRSAVSAQKKAQDPQEVTLEEAQSFTLFLKENWQSCSPPRALRSYSGRNRL